MFFSTTNVVQFEPKCKTLYFNQTLMLSLRHLLEMCRTRSLLETTKRCCVQILKAENSQ